MTPLVSICVPAYGKPEFIRRLLLSVLAQEYKHIEVILSDDTPDDAIEQVAKEYADKLTIHYHHHSPSLKSPRNWNFALDAANGDYIMLLHQDDWLHDPLAINKYLAAFEKNSAVDFIFCRNTAITPQGEAIVLQTFPWLIQTLQKNPYHLVRSDVIGPPSNVMLKKKVSVRYDEELIWLVDVDYYVRIIEAGHQYHYLDQHLVSIGLHDDQMTNYCRENTDIMLKENIFFAYKYKDQVFNDWRLYDYFWRLLRNHTVRNEARLLAAGVPKEKVVPQIISMINSQKLLPIWMLRIGPLSKLIMFLQYYLRP